MIVIANAFSLNMLSPRAHALGFMLADPSVFFSDARASGQTIVSIVGHADTAALFSSILGFPVECNRTNYYLMSHDTLVVGQYSGPRLPEGATTLPEGAEIKWWFITQEAE